MIGLRNRAKNRAYTIQTALYQGPIEFHMLARVLFIESEEAALSN